MAQPLLPDLLIEGYRGLRRLELKKLGNVNLIVGRNGVGKTSVLEAVRLYSSQAAISDLNELLQVREEPSDPSNWKNFEALFYNRSSLNPIRIGPLTLAIREMAQAVDMQGIVHYQFPEDGTTAEASIRVPAIRIEQAGKLIRFAPLTNGTSTGHYIDLPARTPNPSSVSVDSCGLTYEQFGGLWDKIVLTDFEEELNSALIHVIKDIQRVSLVQRDGGSRRAVVKLRNSDRPVPLRTLGDGVYRYIGIALALANARNGFLLIDEFENGLHFTTQEVLWKFVIRMARELNVQVFATTHSRDCIGAFGRATAADPSSEGVLTKLVQQGDGIVARQLEEEDIVLASENLAEIR